MNAILPQSFWIIRLAVLVLALLTLWALNTAQAADGKNNGFGRYFANQPVNDALAQASVNEEMSAEEQAAFIESLQNVEPAAGNNNAVDFLSPSYAPGYGPATNISQDDVNPADIEPAAGDLMFEPVPSELTPARGETIRVDIPTELKAQKQ